MLPAFILHEYKSKLRLLFERKFIIYSFVMAMKRQACALSFNGYDCDIHIYFLILYCLVIPWKGSGHVINTEQFVNVARN